VDFVLKNNKKDLKQQKKSKQNKVKTINQTKNNFVFLAEWNAFANLKIYSLYSKNLSGLCVKKNSKILKIKHFRTKIKKINI
jgi:hypothetical protein